MNESNKMHQNKTVSFLRAPVNAEIMKENRDEVIYVLDKFLILDRNIRNYSPTKTWWCWLYRWLLLLPYEWSRLLLWFLKTFFGHHDSLSLYYKLRATLTTLTVLFTQDPNDPSKIRLSIVSENQFQDHLIGKLFPKQQKTALRIKHTSTTHMNHHSSQTEFKTYECDICAKNFRKFHRLKEHMDIHIQSKTHQCNICFESFKNLTSLQTHKKQHHAAAFKCTECVETFSNHRALSNHAKSIHHSNRPYKCELCDKTYKTMFHLETHLQKHLSERGSNERPYICDICNFAFKQLCTLKLHIKQKHIGGRPHKCDECGAGFNRQDYLIVHKRTHSNEKPYSCHFCDKTFSQVSSLRSHIGIHTGERKFTCEYCDAKFLRKSTLKTHFRTHTGTSI